MISFQEDLLHYVWKLQYFNFNDLSLTDGRALSILHPGFHNFDAGPDFSSGKIRIDEITWNGNIEIHIQSSDWIKHKHQNDPAYDNVILHVVFVNDVDIYRKDGSVIPCLELKDLIDEEIFDRYHYLSMNKQWVPCENLVTEVEDIQKKIWLERLFIARLEEKSKRISEILQQSNHNWEYALFVMIGRYFGSKVNVDAFEYLCRSIDLFTIYKNRHDPNLVESLLFGQAGFLTSEFKDQYPADLQKTYSFLKYKYNLTSIALKNWKFFRLRPINFPTVRIAQFASLIVKNQSLFSRLLELESIEEFTEIFDVHTHEYWDTHYVFDKETSFKEKKIGKGFQNLILINAIIPLIFVYGKARQEAVYVDRAIHLMQQIEPEKNRIISKWRKLKFEITNAAETQALIHLKKEFCDKNRCLQCAIGHQVLKEDFPVYGVMY